MYATIIIVFLAIALVIASVEGVSGFLGDSSFVSGVLFTMIIVLVVAAVLCGDIHIGSR